MASASLLQLLPDDELLRRLIDLNAAARSHLSDLVAHIAEMDKRKLYARESAPSMFAWCRDVLHLSEAEAFLRIRAARASRRYPAILDMLADGRLHLTAVAKLAPHLSKQNAVWLLQLRTQQIRTDRRLENEQTERTRERTKERINLESMVPDRRFEV